MGAPKRNVSYIPCIVCGQAQRFELTPKREVMFRAGYLCSRNCEVRYFASKTAA